jgi:hypothetical protein
MVAKSNILNPETTSRARGNIVPINVDKPAVHGTVKSHSEKRKELGPVHKYDFDIVLDFTNMTRADLIAMATDSAVIKLQANTRSAYHRPYDPEDKSGNMGKDKKSPQMPFAKIAAKHMTGTIDVKTVLMSNTRARGKDKVTKAGDMFAGMSPEQKAATLKMLQNMAKAENAK